MKVFFRFMIFFTLACIFIVLGVVLGDYGPWYLSWLLGTGFMVLVAALSGVLYEAQEDGQPQAELPPGRSGQGK